jgi:hypothetical protein
LYLEIEAVDSAVEIEAAAGGGNISRTKKSCWANILAGVQAREQKNRALGEQNCEKLKKANGEGMSDHLAHRRVGGGHPSRPEDGPEVKVGPILARGERLGQLADGGRRNQNLPRNKHTTNQ